MNVPNLISIFRMLLVPVIIFLLLIFPINQNFYGLWKDTIVINQYHLAISWLVAGVLFTIAAVSDFVDGWWARKFNQITTFGKFFDSIADKMLTNSVIIILACAIIIPIWMAVILVLRDFIIDGVRQVLASKGTVMAADKFGKYKAAFQMLGLTLLFFVNFQWFNGSINGNSSIDQYGWINQVVLIPMYVGTVLSLVSAYNYVYLNRKNLFDMKVIVR